jgi:predicted membrane metal-binding protein
MKNHLLQAYRQAPWRVQLQWIGLFLLGLVLISFVAGVYLNISGRAAAAGRQIQVMENRIGVLKREINDLATQLASITSAEQMRSRVKDTNLHQMNPNLALYIKVPGYQTRASVVLAPPPNASMIEKPLLQPQYTTSLWDWFVDNIWAAPDKPINIDIKVSP